VLLFSDFIGLNSDCIGFVGVIFRFDETQRRQYQRAYSKSYHSLSILLLWQECTGCSPCQCTTIAYFGHLCVRLDCSICI